MAFGFWIALKFRFRWYITHVIQSPFQLSDYCHHIVHHKYGYNSWNKIPAVKWLADSESSQNSAPDGIQHLIHQLISVILGLGLRGHIHNSVKIWLYLESSQNSDHDGIWHLIHQLILVILGLGLGDVGIYIILIAHTALWYLASKKLLHRLLSSDQKADMIKPYGPTQWHSATVLIM